MKTENRCGGNGPGATPETPSASVIPDLIRNLRPHGRATLVAGICIWGIAESGYGLMQVLGWRSSRHALYALTGHFQNPGPFGGFIACVMAVAGAWVMGFADRSRRMTEESWRMTEESRRMKKDGQTEEAYTFRQDWYFFVGDNQADSRDSRYIGFVPGCRELVRPRREDHRGRARGARPAGEGRRRRDAMTRRMTSTIEVNFIG